jgi:hypothetical protein
LHPDGVYPERLEREMAKFFFDLQGRQAFVHDRVGTELADFTSVRTRAAQLARDLLNEAAPESQQPNAWVFHVRDEAGHPVLTIGLSEAVALDDRAESPGENMPAAGPHARPSLMNPDATPGTGALPPVGVSEDPNMQSTS